MHRDTHIDAVDEGTSRRTFLKQLGGVAAGGMALGLLGCTRGSEAGQPPFGPIGIQLYTVRSMMGEDFEGALRRVAEIGYDHFEFAGYYDHATEEVAGLLEELNVNTPATHIGLGALRDRFEEEIARARQLGQQYVVCPYLSQDQRGGPDQYRALADEFNRIGERCREAGLQFGYHNHDFEFASEDGQVLYDILLERTEPELVTMELDVFWMVHAGHDPIAYFERYPGRFGLMHVKDRTESGDMAAVGEGAIDWPTIFSYADQSGTEYFFVEHDNPESPAESIATSYQYLSQLELS